MSGNKKNILIILVLFLIFLSVILLFKALLPVNPLPEEKIQASITPQSTFLNRPTITFPPGGKIIIKDVEVRNFYPQVKEVSPYAEVTLAETEDYIILYYTSTQEFSIAITGAQFEQSRQKAEEEFLSLLGINQIQACRLAVIESTVQFANPDLAGQTFPLSFCPQTP